MSRTFVSLGITASAMLFAAMPLGALAQAVSPPPPGASAPMRGIVNDANDKDMGPFYPSVTIGGRTVSAVLVSLADHPLLIPVVRGKRPGNPLGLMPATNHQRVYFHSNDCTGKGWLEAEANAYPGVSSAAVLLPKPGAQRVSVYVPVEKRPVTEATNSYLFNDPVTGALQCSVEANSGKQFYPVEQVIELSGVYVAPYRLE